MSKTFLAVDFGGGSGRVIAGTLRGSRLSLQEIHRFGNRQVRLGGYLYWDFLALFEDMKEGLRKAASMGLEVESIGIDTWGVDFGLIDRNGNLLGNPVCYRDSHTDGLPEEFFASEDIDAHYAEAGIQVMGINTLFRLMAMKKAEDPKLQLAERLLFMPDLFSYFLTGTANNEYTIASTSELIDARTRTWNRALIRRLGLPEHIFGDIVMPGTSRGCITAEIAAETGLSPDVKVIAVGSHDTASAVYAVPGSYSGDRAAFLSSGTWSLFGVELDSPLLTPEARRAGFTNEGAVGGIKFLQNITGLWILQRLVADWRSRGLTSDFATLTTEAENAAIDSVIDVDDPAFQAPDSMAAAIEEHCRARGMQVPVTRGEFVRCVVNSLAARYKKGVEELNRLLPEPVRRLHIIGGGSNNRLLNRLTAEATGLPVTAGPAEATAIGNILLQAVASGIISEKKQITEIDQP